MLKTKGEEKTIKEPPPIEVQILIEKYKDVISDGTFATLPLRRVISHKIDFVPSISLPKKVTYKLTPNQNLEVARHVQELLDQGMIKMIIRPCEVPILLASKKRGKWKY